MNSPTIPDSTTPEASPVDLSADLRFLHERGLLEPLLADRTTNAPIVWATDAYSAFGLGFLPHDPITPGRLLSTPGFVLRSRAAKDRAAQSSRTKTHAEVFTPLSVCRKMIAALPLPGENTEEFLAATCLELACGEAPFLLQRHDPATAAPIGIADRGGLLDRKLHAAAKLAGDDSSAYPALALRALRSTYAFELQGDSLLIARLSAMLAMLETHRALFPGSAELDNAFLHNAASAVAWNFFQMDALSGTVPALSPNPGGQTALFSLDNFLPPPPPPQPVQTTFGFEDEPAPAPSDSRPPSLVADWENGQSFPLFHAILHPSSTKELPMKFDYIIGNPPYQEETAQGPSLTNGQTPRTNIFHYFQMAADEVANRSVVLIYPGGRWLHRSGKGMEEFGLKQINDPNLKKILFFPDSSDVFPDVAIADGLSIVLKEIGKTKSGFEYVYVCKGKESSYTLSNPGNSLIPLNPNDFEITQKAAAFSKRHNLSSLHERLLPRTLFGIESDFVHNNPEKVTPWQEGMHIDYRKQIKLLTNDKAGKAGRAKWFVADKNILGENHKYLNEWQVVVSSANAGGQKRDNQIEIIDNHSAFGRSRVALASFSTKQEAKNFFRYVCSYICRFLFLMTDEALTTLGKRVPDLGDYTDDNSFFDFTEDVDCQLISLMKLSQDDFDYLKAVVDNLRAAKSKEMM